jgi:hypothetical protein
LGNFLGYKVGAMALNAAELHALFSVIVKHVLVIVPCSAQQSEDSLLTRLLVAGFPSLLALVLAWLVFGWNKANEHRRWTLDQKKAEWQGLMRLASQIESFMPSVEVGGVAINAINDPAFNQHLHDFTRSVLECVFIAADKSEALYQKLVDIQVANENARVEIVGYQLDPARATQQELPRPLQSAKKVQSDLASLWRDIRAYAAADLEVSRHGWRKAVPKF